MMMKLVLIGAALALACGCDRSSEASEEKKVPAKSPFSLSVHKVERHAAVAPNEVWKEQGLGEKAKAGHVFICVLHESKNISQKAEGLGMKELLLGDQVVEAHIGASASFSTSSEWIAEKDERKGGFSLDSNQLKPGGVARTGNCFEVPEKTQEQGATLRMRGGIEGWSVTAQLPKATPPPAAEKPGEGDLSED